MNEETNQAVEAIKQDVGQLNGKSDLDDITVNIEEAVADNLRKPQAEAAPAAEAVPQTQEASKPHRKRQSLSKSARLAQDKLKAQSLAEFYYNETLKLAEDNARKDKLLAEQVGATIDTQLMYLENAMIQASDYEDPEAAKAKISSKMAELYSLKQKNQGNSDQLARKPIYAPQPPQGMTDDVNPNFALWLSDRPEIDQNSPYFNPDVATHVDQAMFNYNNYLNGSGYGHLIGSPQYFDEVDRYIDEEIYGIRQAAPVAQSYNVRPAQPAQNLPPKRPINPVGSNNSMTNQRTNPKSISLTPEEAEIALAVRTHNPNITDAEKLKMFAQNKMKMIAEDNLRRSIPR
jgi:hypothetical protein